MPLAGRRGNMDQRVRPAEFGDALAAAAAGRHQPAVDRHGDDADFGDGTAAVVHGCRDHRGDGRGLGAPAFREGRVLDIAADMQAAGLGAQRYAHREMRIGRMGVLADPTRRFKEF